MGEQLAARDNSPFMPALEIEQAVERRDAIKRFVSRLMEEGRDFGKIPGTDKKTLLKPGAEKLTTLFGLSPSFQVIEKVQDWSGEDHGGEPFFFYWYRCRLHRGDLLIAEGEGSCNSWEKKYRYRTADRACPLCGAATIKRSKFPPRNNKHAAPGWYCFEKIGGCGSEFPVDDPAIVDQVTGNVANPDIADQVNTVLKMAKKRALIDAVLLAVNASEFFTQGLEDFEDTAPPPPPEPQEIVIESRAARRGAGKWDRPDWSDLFFQEALAGGHYEHVNHVKNALKILGYTTLARVQAEEMLKALREHAAKRQAENGNGHDRRAAPAEVQQEIPF